MTRISVLMPVFNAEPYVRQAAQSILAQTAADFEFLVIDDGSTDGSLRILRELAAEDSRIRLVSRENRGLVSTLNEMLTLATGEFIARMDADDVAEPSRFERQLEGFRADPTLVAVGSDIYSIDPKGRRLMTTALPHGHEEIDARTMSVVHGSAMCHPAMMIRASTLAQVGNYRQEFWPAEDADLVLRLAEHGRLANLATPLLSYRVHGGSIGHQNPARQREALFRAASAAAIRRGVALPDASLKTLAREDLEDIETAASREVKWAWWALNNGNVATARSLAFRAVMQAPWAKEGWHVLASAIRGR